MKPGRSGGKKQIMLTDNRRVTESPEIKIIAGEDSTLVCLSGSVDIDSSPALRHQLLSIIDDSNTMTVDVDLTAVSHIDSSGIATLIEALRIARSKKSELRLEGLHGRLLQIFEITGLISLFNGSIGR